MKLYKIKVNGKVYEVELESVSESQAKIETPKASAPAVPAASEGTKIVAPMQGQIIKIPVSVGSVVKRGTVLAILEAMKLENEIQAPGEGTVKQILVSKGQAVDSNQLLFIIG